MNLLTRQLNSVIRKRQSLAVEHAFASDLRLTEITRDEQILDRAIAAMRADIQREKVQMEIYGIDLDVWGEILIGGN